MEMELTKYSGYLQDLHSTWKNFQYLTSGGNNVFVTRDITKGWDGKYKNEILPGTYVYLITGKDLYGKDAVIKGTVALIR